MISSTPATRIRAAWRPLMVVTDDRDLLLLDDDERIIRALRRALRAHYSVRCAGTAAEARDLITARVPAMVLSDYRLAETTAAEFLREVKMRWPEVRCILHSASPAEDWIDLVDDGTLDGVVRKPAPTAEIRDRLDAPRH